MAGLSTVGTYLLTISLGRVVSGGPAFLTWQCHFFLYLLRTYLERSINLSRFSNVGTI